MLRTRRSRRVARGMTVPAGPFTWQSRFAPMPLTEAEEAALAFAACGITGYALADLAYGPNQGGDMLAGHLGRTIPSADAVHTVAVFVINDKGAWLLRRPQDFSHGDISELARLAEQGELVELYRRSRIRIAAHRVAPPLDTRHNFPLNAPFLYASGTTYFLPVVETTALLMNVLLTLFAPPMNIFVRDERAGMRPAGVGKWARSRGGTLCDDPRDGRTATIQALETAILESCAVETGMALQNLALMAEALGLGGYPNFARHESGWFEALGFRMATLPASRYLGLSRPLRFAARLLRRDLPISYPLGLERENNSLLAPFCPPYHPDMTTAVRAFVASKYGAEGSWRVGVEPGVWRDGQPVANATLAPNEDTVAAVCAYCEYVYRRYGRFPAHTAPFRTTIGFQACHLAPEFYARYYRPEALSSTVRADFARAAPC